MRGLIAQTEIDLRLFGMLVALGAILLTFNILSEGKLFQPTNMVTLAVQATGVAIIATGMVLVIVSRNIDLSVGSLVGVIAMTYALLMTDWMPALGMGADFPFRWLIALGLGVGLGALVGGLQGYIIAYVGVPSFIVTLGGLLSIRGVVWYLSSGAAVSGLDPSFQLIGGGAQGSIGGTWTWVLGLVGCAAIVALLVNGRRQRRRFGFPVRPMWAEAVIGVVGCVAVLGVAAFANANLWPEGLANRIAVEQNWGPAPEGGWKISTGFPNPIMLLIAVTLLMTWMATRRRFGRYVYAYGGNPDAADLAGINTRWTILKTYVLMGILCAFAAAIASARLNGATLDVGQSYELYVIAAAVVGGTSFAGGIGTIPGAVLGAFVMQSLAYGLSFIGVNSPGQNVVAGIVLILAVGFDTFNRRRGS
ncbi:MAG: sugar ABC transporter permease [Chloroflexi bacterium]|nr:sugar ABC transporter permease [Chloroflexota bacterium]